MPPTIPPSLQPPTRAATVAQVNQTNVSSRETSVSNSQQRKVLEEQIAILKQKSVDARIRKEAESSVIGSKIQRAKYLGLERQYALQAEALQQSLNQLKNDPSVSFQNIKEVQTQAEAYGQSEYQRITRDASRGRASVRARKESQVYDPNIRPGQIMYNKQFNLYYTKDSQGAIIITSGKKAESNIRAYAAGKPFPSKLQTTKTVNGTKTKQELQIQNIPRTAGEYYSSQLNAYVQESPTGRQGTSYIIPITPSLDTPRVKTPAVIEEFKGEYIEQEPLISVEDSIKDIFSISGIRRVKEYAEEKSSQREIPTVFGGIEAFLKPLSEGETYVGDEPYGVRTVKLGSISPEESPYKEPPTKKQAQFEQAVRSGVDPSVAFLSLEAQIIDKSQKQAKKIQEEYSKKISSGELTFEEAQKEATKKYEGEIKKIVTNTPTPIKLTRNNREKTVKVVALAGQIATEAALLNIYLPTNVATQVNNAAIESLSKQKTLYSGKIIGQSEEGVLTQFRGVRATPSASASQEVDLIAPVFQTGKNTASITGGRGVSKTIIRSFPTGEIKTTTQPFSFTARAEGKITKGTVDRGGTVSEVVTATTSEGAGDVVFGGTKKVTELRNVRERTVYSVENFRSPQEITLLGKKKLQVVTTDVPVKDVRQRFGFVGVSTKTDEGISFIAGTKKKLRVEKLKVKVQGDISSIGRITEPPTQTFYGVTTKGTKKTPLSKTFQEQTQEQSIASLVSPAVSTAGSKAEKTSLELITPKASTIIKPVTRRTASLTLLNTQTTQTTSTEQKPKTLSTQASVTQQKSLQETNVSTLSIQSLGQESLTQQGSLTSQGITSLQTVQTQEQSFIFPGLRTTIPQLGLTSPPGGELNFNPFFFDKDKRPTQKEQVPYDAYAKVGKKYVKLNDTPQSKNSALDMMARFVDEKLSAQGKIVKRKKLSKKSSRKGRMQVVNLPQGDGYYEQNAYKFRNYTVSGGRRKASNTYIEKKRYRFDKPTESKKAAVIKKQKRRTPFGF